MDVYVAWSGFQWFQWKQRGAWACSLVVKPFCSLLGWRRVVRVGPSASVRSFRKVLLWRGRWCGVERLHLFLLFPLGASLEQPVGLDNRGQEKRNQEQIGVGLEIGEGPSELGQRSREGR